MFLFYPYLCFSSSNEHRISHNTLRYCRTVINKTSLGDWHFRMCDMDDFSDDGTDELLCSLPNDVFSEGKNGIEKEKTTPTFLASNSSSAAPDIKNVILRTPEEFPFPFEPYGIQLHFMKALYKCLQEGKIGIFESPTGTGKSLSLICGAFKWLRDFKEQQQKELDELLAKKICETRVNNEPKELDWITEFSIKKKTEEELKQLEEEKKALTNVENKLGHMRERYHKPSKRKCHQLESKFEELKDSFSDELQKAFMAEMNEISNQNSAENGENEDVELVVEEYFSDNEEKIKSGSDDEDDDHVEQEHTLKIYYCSRTHSQLSQFVREIMKSSKSKSDQPKKRSKTNNCPFYKVEHIEDFRDRVLVEVRDIEQLVTLGKQMKSCPYYGTRYAIPNAEIVLLPYNTLLHRTTRESCGIKVKDNIVIIDEAHNLLETINNIHSVEVTGAQMCRAHSQLSQYEQRYRNRLKAKNLMYINQILFILSRFVNYIGGKLNIASNEQHLSKIESKIMTINDFLYETKLDNINLFKVLNYCKKSLISKKLNGFVEKYQPSSVNYVPLKAKEPENSQSGVSQFLKELSEKNKSNFDQVTKVPAYISFWNYLLLFFLKLFASILSGTTYFCSFWNCLLLFFLELLASVLSGTACFCSFWNYLLLFFLELPTSVLSGTACFCSFWNYLLLFFLELLASVLSGTTYFFLELLASVLSGTACFCSFWNCLLLFFLELLASVLSGTACFCSFWNCLLLFFLELPTSVLSGTACFCSFWNCLLLFFLELPASILSGTACFCSFWNCLLLFFLELPTSVLSGTTYFCSFWMYLPALQAPENITSAPEMNSPLMHIEGFLEALTNADKDGRMVLNRKSLLSVSSIKFLLLNPAVEFEVIVNEARSVVIAGGTMQPVSEFKEQLFCSIGVHPERILEYSCGHVIPDNHLLPIALATGPSGREMDFTYQYRDRPQTLEELGHVICNICNIVPGGIVCFFPSYDYEAKVFDFWSKSGVIRRISSKKKVFRESRKPGESDAVLANYSDCVKKLRGPSTSNGPMGAILFSVVGGKMSEGINFSDDLGRCVILVGLPFPNINSPELKEKMDYLNANYPRSSDGRMPGQIHYENLCMKAVNQSIGRAIRHQKDYAIVLLLDRRYQKPSVAAKLPNWIRTLLKNCKFGQAVGAISKFFASKN
ncbi:DDX11 [Acanthosepion pharaonis]|uniref:DDX11 n=1 Tax=Acanthosepion pharaonis TaxID=158019 RepID=A0A812E3E2_ACAPH|nr:DDX11 [Sepia pharaonis]